MKGQHVHVRGIGRVVYIPGQDVLTVTDEDQTMPIPRPHTHKRSPLVMDPRWGARGVLAVWAVLALAMITDGGILMLLAWLQ